jgi:toxin ParE1/3/4
MTARVRVTARARADLRSIGRFTLRTWGRDQRNRYLAALDHRFRWLAEAPKRGRPRPEIGDGYHSYPEGAHVIFYVIREDGIDVIGVPHQAMDVMARLSGPAEL